MKIIDNVFEKMTKVGYFLKEIGWFEKRKVEIKLQTVVITLVMVWTAVNMRKRFCSVSVLLSFWWECSFNPRPAGVWIVTRPAGGGGGAKGPPP